MPIIQRGSSHSERSSLYSRSVLMLPDPTMATDFFCAMDAPLTRMTTGLSPAR